MSRGKDLAAENGKQNNRMSGLPIGGRIARRCGKRSMTLKAGLEHLRGSTL
jgi:hypothetical protein